MVRYYRLKEDHPTTLWGRQVVLPKGTLLDRVGTGYAVHNTGLLINLTGNDHDPKYRYAWVPAALAESVEGTPDPNTIGEGEV